MAHIDIIPVDLPGSESKKPLHFTGDIFQGFNSPCRFEGCVEQLEVWGEIPLSIDGTFYRVMPDHHYPPFVQNEIHFNGDGVISAFKIANGECDFQQMAVRTHRFLAEKRHRRALFGKYRNAYTDNPIVEGVLRTISNTNIVFHRGVLLALKEDGPPFAMDPTTLETYGVWDFQGQIKTPTSTAHPKFDPLTGDMVCYGYEAKGEGSKDVVVYNLDKEGKKTEENYIIFPLTSITADIDRIKRGGNHFAWQPQLDQAYGVLPRHGAKSEDIKWFYADNAFHGHVANAYENEEGKIVMDLTVADGNVFYFFPEDESKVSAPARVKFTSPMHRWVFDPKAPTGTRYQPYELFDTQGEFARSDDRYLGQPYNHFFLCVIDPTKPYNFQKCGPPAGGLFNCYGHFDWKTLSKSVWFAGDCSTVQEPVFIPRSADAPEGDGYLMGLVNRLDELRNDLVILDTARPFEDGPIAVIKLPFKLRTGLHGNFVEAKEIHEWNQRLPRDQIPRQNIEEVIKPKPGSVYRDGLKPIMSGILQPVAAVNGTNGVNGTH
ncbi:carotenoid cleavage dioxygenase [Dacryopinax primogenitus]|uniref:Carotenoid cleavage dioxygenase n=1 Tax=Dacryopinax primogenitus (strain DJM 731) TaxID=1858805 RepID=M5FVT8_DACPD|nr:carotenoid cleavage dioxygenase [Dacryopinax primogenitus]EJT99709.1 carotenoid cleavage dioxygenase [Dacryopinax primogenitus]